MPPVLDRRIPDPDFLECRAVAQKIATYLTTDSQLKRHTKAMEDCGAGLVNLYDSTQGRRHFFCHKRFCPVCQYRKVWRWRRVARHRLERAKRLYPKAQLIFLTLTVRTIPVGELRTMVRHHMNVAYRKLRMTPHWQKGVLGDLRFLEVVPGQHDAGYAHPHFHCILLVRPSMWGGKDYVSTKRWQEIWAQCLGQQDHPELEKEHIKALDEKTLLKRIESMAGYCSKPMTLESLPPAPWVCEAISQLKGLRMVTAGGAMRAIAETLCDDETISRRLERWEKDIQRILEDPDIPWTDEAMSAERMTRSS